MRREVEDDDEDEDESSALPPFHSYRLSCRLFSSMKKETHPMTHRFPERYSVAWHCGKPVFLELTHKGREVLSEFTPKSASGKKQ